jgi:hypothetical protein
MNQALNLDMLAKNYEEDLLYLLYQASSEDYETLMNSYLVLVDLFCMIKNWRGWRIPIVMCLLQLL